jgi:hypothetical protein
VSVGAGRPRPLPDRLAPLAQPAGKLAAGVIVAATGPPAQLVNLVVPGQAVRLPPLSGVAWVCSWRTGQRMTSPDFDSGYAAHQVRRSAFRCCIRNDPPVRDELHQAEPSPRLRERVGRPCYLRCR